MATRACYLYCDRPDRHIRLLARLAAPLAQASSSIVAASHTAKSLATSSPAVLIAAGKIRVSAGQTKILCPRAAQQIRPCTVMERMMSGDHDATILTGLRKALEAQAHPLRCNQPCAAHRYSSADRMPAPSLH